MIKKSFLFFIVLTISAFYGFSQEKENMKRFEADLNVLFIQVKNEPTDNERYNANEQALILFQEALKEHKSFFWKWDSLKNWISILESDDKKFKIFTWSILRDNGESESFGLMQVENENTKEYDVYVLVDKSDDMPHAEQGTLSPANWYGVVYYQLITTRFENKTFYTLLGWTDHNQVFQKKVIETIGFKSSTTEPIFGQAIFAKEKKRKRIIFEFSKTAEMILTYGPQHYVETIKIKKSRKDPVKIEEKDVKQNMIIFDVLIPHLEGLEGLPQYYIPSGETSGYYFEKNKWVLKTDIIPRAGKNKTMDNTKPYQKKRPVYEHGKQK